MDQAFVWSRERREGFCARLAQADLAASIHELSVQADHLAAARERKRLVAWLRSLPRPFGLMLDSDDHSLGVIEACAEAACRIPDDVAIVSVGNDETICGLTFPPLSSISLNTVQGGYAVAKNLARQMAGCRCDGRIVVEPLGVVPRGSSDILAIDNPEVAKAIRFVQRNAAQALRVDDVVPRNGAISASTL